MFVLVGGFGAGDLEELVDCGFEAVPAAFVESEVGAAGRTGGDREVACRVEVTGEGMGIDGIAEQSEAAGRGVELAWLAGLAPGPGERFERRLQLEQPRGLEASRCRRGRGCSAGRQLPRRGC